MMHDRLRPARKQIVKAGKVVDTLVNVQGFRSFSVQVTDRDGTDIFQIDGAVNGLTFSANLYTTGADGNGTFQAQVSRLRIQKTSGSGVATNVWLLMNPLP